MWVIKFLSRSDGNKEYFGKYLKYYDPGYMFNGQYDGGRLIITENIADAQKFATSQDAFQKWHSVAPEPYSIRSDGKLNKPLTAFSVMIIAEEQNEEINSEVGG